MHSSTALPARFVAKKQSILSQLALDPSTYDDKSPKGSVDTQILDLIRLINSVDGWVTTSSCAGRVAVFVEGPKKELPSEAFENGSNTDEQQGIAANGREAEVSVKTAPGGKGGGRWLFVSHDPLDTVADRPNTPSWTEKFGLSSPTARAQHYSTQSSQLIHLTYSPLILHILCANLHYAKPLLSAAINASFRESGVQSLKALDPSFDGEGVMVAIRTNGIVFESVVGICNPAADTVESIVSEGYLEMCVSVVNERFQWNEVRKQRLVHELRSAQNRAAWSEATAVESKEERRERKRREGLAVQKESAKREKCNDDAGLYNLPG